MGTKIIKKAKLCNINMVYDAHHLILGIFHESKVHLYVVYRVNVCVQCLFYEFKFIRWKVNKEQFIQINSQISYECLMKIFRSGELFDSWFRWIWVTLFSSFKWLMFDHVISITIYNIKIFFIIRASNILKC